MTSAECTVCRIAKPVGLTVTFPDRKGVWQQHRYCTPCAVWLGEIEEERSVRAVELAERSGV